jgi:hypothetical protein
LKMVAASFSPAGHPASTTLMWLKRAPYSAFNPFSTMCTMPVIPLPVSKLK